MLFSRFNSFFKSARAFLLLDIAMIYTVIDKLTFYLYRQKAH